MKPKADTISIRVKEADQSETTFKLKPTTKLGKLMSGWIAKKGVDPGSVRFLFDATRIKEDDTAEGVRARARTCAGRAQRCCARDVAAPWSAG